MDYSPFRRSLLLAAVTLPLASVFTPLFAASQQEKLASLQEKLAELERSSGGRLGLSAIDTANNRQFQYRADERFPLCSTFKVMLVGAILKKSMTDSTFLHQHINYTQDDIVIYSAITEKRVAEGMTIFDLCDAAMVYSDNTAANLLMKILGGPQAVTEFARSIGDETFRIDRWEPELNSAVPGDSKDTTTPDAMAKSLQKLALGDVLTGVQRDQLQIWLKSNKTGNDSIRAGMPKGWTVGDKTGGGDFGTTNDIAVLWPQTGKPVVLSLYFTQPDKDAKSRKDVLASATRILLGSLS